MKRSELVKNANAQKMLKYGLITWLVVIVLNIVVAEVLFAKCSTLNPGSCSDGFLELEKIIGRVLQVVGWGALLIAVMGGVLWLFSRKKAA